MDTRKIVLEYLRRSGVSHEALGERVGLHRVTMTRYLNYSIDLAGDRLTALMDEVGYTWSPKPGRGPAAAPKGRRTMETATKSAPYELVRELVERHGGSMTFHAGGGPGGHWRIELEGRVLAVDARDRRVNDLDRLYEARIENPQTWDDYDPQAPLKPDAFWQLIKLMDFRGAAVVAAEDWETGLTRKQVENWRRFRDEILAGKHAECRPYTLSQLVRFWHGTPENPRRGMNMPRLLKACREGTIGEVE